MRSMKYKLTQMPNKYCKSTILYTEKYLKNNYKSCCPGKDFCQTVQTAQYGPLPRQYGPLPRQYGPLPRQNNISAAGVRYLSVALNVYNRRNIGWITFCAVLSLSFLSLPASHLCHQGLG